MKGSWPPTRLGKVMIEATRCSGKAHGSRRLGILLFRRCTIIDTLMLRSAAGTSTSSSVTTSSSGNRILAGLLHLGSTGCAGTSSEKSVKFHSKYWLAGVAFLGAGLWAWSEKGVLSDLTKVTRLHGIDPVVLVLIVGVVMFTLGFAGCVGALRENICLLKFFCGAIVLIFFLELAVAVLAFLFQDWVRDRFREFFESNIRSYRDDIDLQNLIDSLQKANQCCGAYGPEDWDLNVYFNCSGASYSREKCGVPFSCCVPDPAQKVVNTQCGYDVRTQLKSKWDEFIFTKGCIQALEGWLPRNIYIVAGVFIAISLLQIFGIFLARTLISDIEAVKAGHHF
ncbi:tetraspanin-14 isoform X1 [Pteropus alecto]|uniref:tetraspanin-14 isoform X1 n=1 Tax=Pteropus alecto TaxID=9402 RepID=UPI000D535CE2|nr:tetraspanin-14 isoform X1 [Pteropus alecto]